MMVGAAYDLERCENFINYVRNQPGKTYQSLIHGIWPTNSVAGRISSLLRRDESNRKSSKKASSRKSSSSSTKKSEVLQRESQAQVIDVSV
ncbi:MAG: hypothetical protein SGPRY_008122 [Prymnesium sp.]